MSYKVRIDSFEGPFDLLLYLVSRQKVDIGAISITQIADQYLAEVSRMDNLDLDVASDFLLVASTLLEIKAESLLPRERDAVAEEFEELAPSEARDILVERLLAYKQYKNAASALHMRFVSEGRMHPRPFGPDACFLNLMPDYLKDVTMDGLALLAARAGATYVSPFLGRLDDISQRGIELIETIHDMFLNYPDIETQIIAASVRNPMHVTDCALAGADIATVPYKVIEQMLHHPLTDSGIEKFKEDYCKVFGE